MRNFNSQEGILKPILRIKIAPEGLSILDSEYKNVQSRDSLCFKKGHYHFARAAYQKSLAKKQ